MAPPYDGIVSDGFNEFHFTFFVIIFGEFFCKRGCLTKGKLKYVKPSELAVTA